MARRKRLLKLILGILIGIFTSHLFTSTKLATFDMCYTRERKHITPVQLIREEDARASNKNLLFVGVMTAAKYLDSRAKVVYDTWGREVPGKVMFYSSEFSYSEHVPLVPLDGVDDGYPPQKKSFMMLKHMHDHYVDQYEWFLRADDDVYIRPDRLEDLLRSVDSKKPWFIGQTGRGNSEEFGLLSLETDENFCMGGPGVIFSRETLKRIAPHVEDCLEHLYTTHEDVELGRCVRRFAGISCTWSYEMQVILYHNQSGENAFTGDLKQKEVHRAITMHPVKQPQYMYRLHRYVKVGRPTSINRYAPTKLEDVLEWELISKTLYSHRDLNPRKRIGSSMKEGLGDITREIMQLINSFSKQRGRVIDFKEILYGYWRLDPVYGVDLILDMLLVYKKYRGHKMTVQVRRHAYIQQTFTGIFVKEVDNHEYPAASQYPPSTEPLPVHKKLVHQLFSKLSENLQPILNLPNATRKTYVNFVLPLSGRFDTFRRFLRTYEDVCLKEKEYSRLYVVLYRNDDSPADFEKTARLLEDVSRKYDDSEIRVIRSNETFARGKALQLGVNALPDEELLLFIDVDMVFDRKSLERVRRNAARGRAIYFPIVYSLYDPALSNKSYTDADHEAFTSDCVDEETGFWRQFGFGIVGLYKSDYLALGGFNLMISGWGYEDVTFYDNAVKSGLRIARSVDPDLVHVFHSVRCDDHLDIEQKSMCVGTRASTLGSVGRLQTVYLRHRDLFR